MAEAYRENQSEANEETILKNAHDLYKAKMCNKFDLMHWWYLFNDQPKWETFCDKSLGASSKHLRKNDVGGYSQNSTPGTPSTPSIRDTQVTISSDDTQIYEVGGLVRPAGRTTTKRKAKAVAEDSMLEVMTKEFSILGQQR